MVGGVGASLTLLSRILWLIRNLINISQYLPLLHEGVKFGAFENDYEWAVRVFFTSESHHCPQEAAQNIGLVHHGHCQHCHLLQHLSWCLQAWSDHPWITPVPKPGDPLEPKSWRPVMILPEVSKILEKVLNAKLQDHLRRNGLLSPEQHAYKPQMST